MGALDKINSFQAVIFFDGVCNLCNSLVRFIIRRDARHFFRFAPLQSPLGEAIAREHGLDAAAGIILYVQGRVYVKSTAALRTARKLSGLWPGMYGFIVVPKALRDWVYDRIADNRYRWFGKSDHCMVPTPDLRERFLETS